jgi:protein-disulfide isomerase
MSLPSLSRRTALAGLGAALALPAFGRRATAAVTPAAVFDDPDSPVLGAADGDVTVAVYFDYQCPFCRSTEPKLMRVVDEDRHVRVVLKDWPIFGPLSVEAARRVWSSRRQGRLAAAHAALMSVSGRLSEAILGERLAAAGVDGDRLAADVAADRAAFDALVARSEEQATAFDFPGTPAYVIGPFVFPGVLDESGFRQAIADARSRARTSAGPRIR